ncbi:CRISPR-associated endonuclease/helicase Cas3 [Streptomyces sp. SAI-135]|uniref:CRISPR-associated helicase Cas3' n=1 Tax=unclassified Streptomyces TaxID=2593676 RepID=UPI00247509B4|nr:MULTISPECIES: CRISPR-associated helicase Cas3' [unclassified Streptomyces]MDH6521979.1 CRISPR-associated endonuclease/helicase Cas3 [Streptomyces sp. SAI-090]MDH6573348.1 CRISPR-associated endonuclease/helicase Cas3 [Streptomyces sp. SAI-117]MDH6613918.1 CRISPR-associated endonuclease/helicase Cas3 [Streptomyces sp. SAI-135]
MTSGEAGCGLLSLLGVPARSVWAKHDRDGDGWMPLWRHMEDSAAVAGFLWDEWLPAGVRALIAGVLPGGEADGRRLALWLAGVHDVGKATPAFACQVEQLADGMREQGLEMRSRQAMGPDRRLAPHGLAGQVLLGEWLQERHGWPARQVGQFVVVVGGHHGVPPDSGQIKALYEHEELLRTPGRSTGVWRQVQTEFLDACAKRFGVWERLEAWRAVKLPQPAQVLLTAVVIVADWIASNPDLFPYVPDTGSAGGEERLAAAWRGLDLPAPWRAKEPVGSVQELFASRFGLPAGATVRPVQEAAVQLARDMDVPGLMVIEAPMGEGKTEAALAVAEVFAARSGAGGVFFALPTMATGNAMFPRLLEWLKRLPADGGPRHSVHLAHSKAALNEDFAPLLARGGHVRAVEVDAEIPATRPGGQESQRAGAELVAHAWLRGRKRAMLASFVAGTVDQLLFAGLKSRHLALRHLAVAGKVVVIDEAHAYDTYMNVYLDRVLAWLGAYGVPVVVLSATLPAGRRRELVNAYAGASGAGVEAGVPEGEGAYPLLTAVAPGGVPVVRCPQASARSTDVQVEQLADGTQVLAERLERELVDGGCVLVVRNTVKRVLETVRVLRSRFDDDEVTVAHSCFVDLDRAAKDRDLLQRFGPPDKAEGRPTGRHIVVASQVAEQSLDVDFDLLVSDVCPVDLLLQRMGRLHRHQRGKRQEQRPERLRQARCLLTGMDWQAQVPVPVRGSVAVYGAYALLRSAAVLLPPLDGPRRPVRLPADISPLVQGAYSQTPAVPKEWETALEEARGRFERHRADQSERAAVFRLGEVGRPGRPLFGWVAAGVGDADDTRAGRAQVRDSRETLEVVVVQRRADGALVTLPWLGTDEKGRQRGGLELPQDQVPAPFAGRAAASCGLRLPLQFSYAQTLDAAIAELKQLHVSAWQRKDSTWLAGQLILALDEDCQTSLAGFHLRYSPADGLEVTRAEQRK